jgi:hypothetical protein
MYGLLMLAFNSDISIYVCYVGEVSYHLFPTNSDLQYILVFFCYVFSHVNMSRWSSWLQIQRSGFDFGRYQIFWEVVGLERGPLCLVSATWKKNQRLRSRKPRVRP